jgi:hypothetical protein
LFFGFQLGKEFFSVDALTSLQRIDGSGNHQFELLIVFGTLAGVKKMTNGGSNERRGILKTPALQFAFDEALSLFIKFDGHAHALVPEYRGGYIAAKVPSGARRGSA